MSLVLVWHYVVNQVQAEPGSALAYAVRSLSFSWAGVDLFFVLSGFLIGGILMDNAKAPHYYRAFFARRGSRIIPVYLLVLALFVWGSALRAQDWGPGFLWLFERPLPTWSYAAYVQNVAMAAAGSLGPHWMGVTWSLAIEEQFYLLLPFLIRFTSGRMLPWVLMCLVATAPLLRVFLFHVSPLGGLAGYLLLPARWDSLFLGVLGAYGFRNARWSQWLASRLWVLRAIVLASLVILALLLASHQGIGSRWMSYVGHTVLGFLGLASIALGLLGPNALQRLFRNRLLGRIGGISYGIYLFHQPVSGLVHGSLLDQAPQIRSWSDAGVTGLAFVLTLLLAQVSWSLFERYLVEFGRRSSYE